MSEQMVEGQLDIYEVLELVEQEKDDDEDEPLMWHIEANMLPRRALCGYKLLGIDGGYTAPDAGNIDCVVCAGLYLGGMR